MKTAILVDGGFFLRRYRRIYGDTDAATAASKMHELCMSHLYDRKTRKRESDLYRILFYDCPPLDKKAHYPVSRKSIDFRKTDTFKFRTELHTEVKKLRKVALRLGHLRDGDGWTLKPHATKDLIAKRLTSKDLADEHFSYEVQQKSVDMKIGLDIASLCYKRLVDQIVLFAGDSDFVPAAKLARREGVDVILDSMWQPMSEDLREHIDGLRSTCPQPKPRKKATKTLPAAS